MTERIQEFVDSRDQSLRLDRTRGVLSGVKLLGLTSRNGRTYREQALSRATGLYEGAKVNVNHPKSGPRSPRDYQERLGAIQNVEFRPGEGLFGDLHFNPKHAVSEQLMWDAEHAPQQVGLSHNVLAHTKREGDTIVVEAIAKVESVDLVADPATTRGLFEATEESAGDSGTELDSVTLAELKLARPDLIAAIAAPLEEQVESTGRQLKAIERVFRIVKLLDQYGLPLPGDKDPTSPLITSEAFLDSLTEATTDVQLEQRIADRAAAIRAIRETETPVHSREQRTVYDAHQVQSPSTAAEFAAALRN